MDIIYDINHWGEQEHPWINLAIDAAALFPFVGSFKYADEVKDAVKPGVKNLDEVADGVKAGNKSSINNIRIINKKYAGKTFKLSGDLAKKYPKGVKFSEEGFPDFEPYGVNRVIVDNLEGDRYYDFIKANEKAGYNSTPKGYTWHHVEDGKTLILVPSDLHNAVRQTGGASLIRKGIKP